MKKFLTAEQAISLLPEGETIHTFYGGVALIGAEWERQDVIDKLKSVDKIEIAGEFARRMGHGLAVYNDSAEYLSDILFVETDKKKLDAFDPIVESTMDKEILELVSVFLEEKGYDVDYTDGALYVNSEDTNTGVKISCEVIP